jgi:SPP1 gp7 family putative phage head morphogenesis protein
MVRHQVYLERFKLGAAATFAPVIAQIDDGLRREFSVLRVPSLDQLTKANLNKLLAAAAHLVDHALIRYAKALLAFLRKFMRAEITMFDAMLEGAEAPDGARLWSSILNAPLPGNGQYAEAMLKALRAATQSRVADTIRRGYANATEVSAALAALVGGSSVLFGASVLSRALVQNATLVDTIIQHISQMASAAVAATIFQEYTWISVIDKGTTPICLERNGQVYTYGKGPLPPAHYQCRSMTVPDVIDNPPTSFYSWLKNQPPEIVIDMIGRRNASALSSGQAKASDFAGLRNPAPLSLDAFEAKLAVIIQ